MVFVLQEHNTGWHRYFSSFFKMAINNHSQSNCNVTYFSLKCNNINYIKLEMNRLTDVLCDNFKNRLFITHNEIIRGEATLYFDIFQFTNITCTDICKGGGVILRGV